MNQQGPWSVPSSWEWIKISDLGRVVGGGTPSSKEPSYWGGEVSWISPADLTGYSKKVISRGAKSPTEEGLKNSSAKVMPAGSIHFSSRAPIGYVVISAQPMATNQGFKSLVPESGIFNEYIYYYLKSSKQLAEKHASGTTFLELSGKAFGLLPVPLPPTAEQRRIVAKIEALFSELDKGIETLKTAREQLKVYRQAVLKHAFEGKLTARWREENEDKLVAPEQLLARIQQERQDRYQQQLDEWKTAVKLWKSTGEEGKKPAKPREQKVSAPIIEEELAVSSNLPQGWTWVRLESISSIIAGNAFKKAEYSDTGVRLFQIANVTFGGIVWDKVVYLPEDYWDLYPELRLDAGDLVMALNRPLLGDDLKIGRLGIADGPSILYQRVGKFIPNNAKMTDLIYWYLRSPDFIRALKIELRGVNIPFINQSRLMEYLVPVCSASELEELFGILERCFSVLDQLDHTVSSSLGKLEALRQSILKKAFSGELVPQDPNDEPASKLLERIRAEKAKHSAAKPVKRKKTRRKRSASAG